MKDIVPKNYKSKIALDILHCSEKEKKPYILEADKIMAKKNKTEVQRQITTQNKQHIKKIHKSADEKFKNNEIDRNTYLNISHTLQRGEDLIDRGSKGLVKDDYIVIICMLKPEYMPQKTLLSNKKNDDLIFIICSIIYDVNAIETKMNNSIVNVNTITANNTKQIKNL